MHDERFEIAVADGTADARLFLPDGDGPWPAIVFYMDAGGLRPAMARMAARLASAGYAVIQPNLYWRSGPYRPFDAATVFGDPVERARLGELMKSVHPADVVADTVALLDALGADRRARQGPVGVVGYCMGGRMAVIAAAAFPERVAAAAAIHPGGLVTAGPDSPHLGAERIRAALYLGIADGDASCTPEHQAALRAAFDAASVRYTLEVYEGARHGFAVPDFTVYDPAASERHWERILALFAEHVA